MMVPSRADMRPVIIREAMMAQNRQVFCMVGLSWVATTSVIASSFADILFLGDVLERPDVVPWVVVCTRAGCSS